MLTAAAAILGRLHPIIADVFWGPMAYAGDVSGLAVATVLTLVFLPQALCRRGSTAFRGEGRTNRSP